MKMESLSGVWVLKQMVKHISEDRKEYPWGEDVTGQLIYTSTGHMSVVYMKKGRKRFESSDVFAGTYEEIKDAFLTFDAYTGTYKIDPEAATVTHRVLASRQPNLEGVSLCRYIRLTGDILELTTPPVPAGGKKFKYTLTWQRGA